MSLYRNLELGYYHPVWRSITINDDVIRENYDNPELFSSLVTIHENVHWHQMMASTCGHYLTMLHMHRRLTVRNFLIGFKMYNPDVQIELPLLDWAASYSSQCDDERTRNIIQIFTNDLASYDLCLRFFHNEITENELKSEWASVNQALFSSYDIYIERTRELLESKFDVSKIIQVNRAFWDNDNHNKVFIDPSGKIILSFTDIIECSARLVEYTHFKNVCRIYQIAPNVKIEELFLDEYYQKAMGLLQRELRFTVITDEIRELLALLLFISINPPIIPHFLSCWQDHISATDIHPGLRYMQLCLALSLKYQSVDEVLAEKDLEGEMCNFLGWPTSAQLGNEIQKLFGEIHERVLKITAGDKIMADAKLYDVELWLSDFCGSSNLRKNYRDYFVNAGNFLTGEKNLETAEKIDRELHCPVIYNSKINKYQINIGGVTVNYVNQSSETEDAYSNSKPLTDKLQQLAINQIKDGLHYELDDQILYSDKLDILSLPEIDAQNDLINSLVRLYMISNEGHLDHLLPKTS